MIEQLRVGAIQTNCYLVPVGALDDEGREACLVVDPGEDASRILAALDARRLVPVLIALTHGHLDHCAGIPALGELLIARGMRPPVAIHRADSGYLGVAAESRHRELFEAIGAAPFFRTLWHPLPAADLLLEEGDDLGGTAWKVLHCPGHSAGSAAFYNPDEGILISGDTLFRSGVGRTDAPDSDPKALERSITEKLFTLPPTTKVLPGHGPATSIGRESGAGN